MAKFSIHAGWTETDGTRWTAFYVRNRRHVNAAMDQAFKDFNNIIRDSTVVGAVAVKVMKGECVDFPPEICNFANSMIGNTLNLGRGRIHALAEDGRTRLYMIGEGLIGISDWHCGTSNPKAYMVGVAE